MLYESMYSKSTFLKIAARKYKRIVALLAVSNKKEYIL